MAGHDRRQPVTRFLPANWCRHVADGGHQTQNDDDYLDRARSVADHMVTPGWVLHHLREHEAEHRSQIQSVITALKDCQLTQP